MVCPQGIRMGEFVGRAGRKGVNFGGEGEGDGIGVSGAWDQRFVSSDRDWHFEGRISVLSDCGVEVRGEVL